MQMRFLITFFLLIFLQFFAYSANSCKSFTEEFITISRTKSSIKEYLLQTIDTKYITKFSLGSNWRSLLPEQRRQFHDIYSQYIISKYSSQLKKYPSISHSITSVERDKRRENICNVQIVITTLVNSEKKNFPIEAVIVNNNGDFKIQDIIFENVSMLQTHKQEISSLMETKKIDGTITILKNYISQEK